MRSYNIKNMKITVENKILASLSYLGILVIIPILFNKKKNKFVLFHAKQGLILLFVEIIISFVNVVPLLGMLVWFLAVFIFIIISVVGILKVWQEKEWQMPIVSDYVNKLRV